MSGNGISWAVCKSAPRSRQITMPAPHQSVFYRPDALLQHNQQRQSTEGMSSNSNSFFIITAHNSWSAAMIWPDYHADNVTAAKNWKNSNIWKSSSCKHFKSVEQLIVHKQRPFQACLTCCLYEAVVKICTMQITEWPQDRFLNKVLLDNDKETMWIL